MWISRNAVDDQMKHVTRLCSLLLALRIHCSDQCKQMLDKLGGYILEPRGTVTIKVCGLFLVLPDVLCLSIFRPLQFLTSLHCYLLGLLIFIYTYT